VHHPWVARNERLISPSLFATLTDPRKAHCSNAKIHGSSTRSFPATGSGSDISATTATFRIRSEQVDGQRSAINGKFVVIRSDHEISIGANRDADVGEGFSCS
jgi:hypothetical protein